MATDLNESIMSAVNVLSREKFSLRHQFLQAEICYESPHCQLHADLCFVFHVAIAPGL